MVDQDIRPKDKQGDIVACHTVAKEEGKMAKR
jgi:hypothetical protein